MPHLASASVILVVLVLSLEVLRIEIDRRAQRRLVLALIATLRELVEATQSRRPALPRPPITTKLRMRRARR